MKRIALLLSLLLSPLVHAAGPASPYLPKPHIVWTAEEGMAVTMQPTMYGGMLISPDGNGDDWTPMTGTAAVAVQPNSYVGLLVCTANCSSPYGQTWGPWSGTGGSGSASFSAITSGTNNTAAMVVDSGASLNPTGTGVINANQVNGSAVPASVAVLGSNSSRQLVAATSAGIVSTLGYTPAAIANLPATGLLAYYQFNETSGTVLTDFSGNGNNGTITVAPTMTGTAYQFTSTSQNVNLPTALNASNTYHILVNYPPALFGTTSVFTFSPLASSSTSTGFEIISSIPQGSGASGNWNLILRNIQGGSFIRASSDWFSGTHVLSVVCTASVAPSLYIDGNPVTAYDSGTTGITCNGLQTVGNLRFGTSASNSGLTMNGGSISGAAFYSTVQTAAQVQQTATAMIQQAANRGVQFLPVSNGGAATYIFFAGDSITCGSGIGGSPACATGTTSSLSYTTTVPASTNNTYVSLNFGVPGAYVQQQIASSPYGYAPLCKSQKGSSIAVLFEGTNNYLTSGVTAAQIFALQTAWTRILKNAGCRVILAGMLSRTGNVAGGATTYDAAKNDLNALMRSGWQQAGADGFVDFGAVPNLGKDGAYANATYFQGDGIHPTLASQPIMSTAFANEINSIDGSSPSSMNQTPLTGTGTLTYADGGRLFDATTGNVNWTLPSAQAQTGRSVRYCNVTTSGSNTVTITAPPDFTFNNDGVTTTITIAKGTCSTLSSTWNGITGSTTGDYWRTN